MEQDIYIYIVCPHCNTTNRMPAQRLTDRGRCGVCKKSLFTGIPSILTFDNFEKNITENSIPVVVDFWASWCGPCKMMAPAFEQAAALFEPRVRFAKLNIDEEAAIAQRYAIAAVPTTVLFRNGKEIVRQPGAMNFGMLKSWIENAVGKAD